MVRGWAVDPKITAIDGKYCSDVLSAGQMNECGIGKLWFQLSIPFHDCGNRYSVRLIQVENPVKAESCRLQQLFDSARIESQEPGSFGQQA
jgi:hypothetical protein